MRINKLLSNRGICSRKETARLISENRITVNGKLCVQGQWVEEDDNILLDNKPLPVKKKIYIALNKPQGITCTSERNVKNNIIEYMDYDEYIFPVGRLDKESEGLILLTNDGDMANKILESKNFHEKEYIVTLKEKYNDEFIEKMKNGVHILKTETRKCDVKPIDDFTFNIILTQGLNRQIRRMCRCLGYTVDNLQRIRILNIKLDGIEKGKWRYLKEEEIKQLKNLL